MVRPADDLVRPPFPLHFDRRVCLPGVDLSSSVQPLLRWAPVANTSVLIGAGGDPLLPSWVSAHGLVIRQVTRRWLDVPTHAVSIRLALPWGQAIYTGTAIIARHGLAKLEDRCDYLFRFANIPEVCRAPYRAFLRSAVAGASAALAVTARGGRATDCVDDAS